MTSGEIPHTSNNMSRTLSKPSVLKRLRDGGFDMTAILEQNRGEIEVGHLTDGRATWEQREANVKLAELASKLLGWGFYVSNYGSCWLVADMGCDVTRELIRNNMD